MLSLVGWYLLELEISKIENKKALEDDNKFLSEQERSRPQKPKQINRKNRLKSKVLFDKIQFISILAMFLVGM